MKADILSGLADDKFRAIAFAEYTARAQERYAKLIAFVSDIPEHVPDRDNLDDSPVEPMSETEVNNLAMSLMEDAGYSIGTGLPLAEGYADLFTIVKASIKSADATANFTKYGDNVTGGVNDLLNVHVRDVLGASAGYVDIPISTLGQELQSNLHSITCLSAAAKAYVDKLEGRISDVITSFNDKLADVFAQAHADISSSAGYFKELLVSAPSATAFITQALSTCGIKQESEAEVGHGDDFTMANSDVYQYTGASPSSAIDFSNLAKIGSNVVKVAATVSVGIVKGLWTLGKSIFSKVLSKAQEIIIDPNDLDICNEDGVATIDGFQIQDHFNTSYIDLIGNPTVEECINFRDDFISKDLNKWFVVKTKFGEIAVRYTSLTLAPGTTNFSIAGDLAIKPKIINPNVVRQVIDNYDSAHMTVAQIAEFLTKLEEQGAALYDISNIEENIAAEGAIFSVYLLNKISLIGLYELTDDYRLSDDNDLSFVAEWSLGITSVTNQWWLIFASGWNPELQNFYANLQALLPSPPAGSDWNDYANMEATAEVWSKAIVNVLGYEFYRPANESPFVPFSENVTSFSASKYRIKTDQQNIDAFNKFITAVVVVVIVVAVAAGALIAIKKHNANKFMKYTQIQGHLDNKMWNADGSDDHPFLTKKEKRQYLRAKRKLEKINLFSGSLNNPASVFKSDATLPGSDNDAIAQVYSSIVG